MCTSLSTCSYLGLNIVSNTALNLAATELFDRHFEVRRFSLPFATALLTKLLSFVPYYLSIETQYTYSHPITGSGLPGTVALATGFVSSRVSTFFTFPKEITSVALSSISSLVHFGINNEFSQKSYCNENAHGGNQTIIPEADRTLGFIAAFTTIYGQYLTALSARQIVINRMNDENQIQPYLLTGLFLANIQPLISIVSDATKTFFLRCTHGLISFPVVIGMASGVMNYIERHSLLEDHSQTGFSSTKFLMRIFGVINTIGFLVCFKRDE